MSHRDQFDLTIGRLDRVLSELVAYARSGELDDQDKQTLKHHAEDMEAAAKHIYKKLDIVEGVPQPTQVVPEVRSLPAASEYVLRDIYHERVRQIGKGWDFDHDDRHREGLLTKQAIGILNYPTSKDSWGIAEKWKNDRRRQLVIAAALIVAEIEKADRKNQP